MDDTIDQNEIVAFFQVTCEVLCAADNTLCGCRTDPIDQLFGLYEANQEIGHDAFALLVEDA
jgi:hypothetical protein